MSPDDVIEEIAASGLRGRGGGGFPTGEKWAAIRRYGTGTRYVVCNGAEGEPATFKDRILLQTNPYRVLEGSSIAAYAVGAERAFLAMAMRAGALTCGDGKQVVRPLHTRASRASGPFARRCVVDQRLTGRLVAALAA